MSRADYADLTSHDAFVNGVPHDTFAALRREDPISWWDEEDGKGFWSITRYQDIFDINKDYKTFSSAQGVRLEEMDEEESEARRSMLETDPPEHTRLRHLVGRSFGPQVVATYEEAIRGIAVNLLEHAASHDEFDFVQNVSRPLPMRMLGRLLGVPDSDGQMLVELGDMMIANTDEDFTEHVVDQVDTEEWRLLPFRSPAALKVFEYAEEAAHERREHPTEDLINLLLSPDRHGERLSELEFKNFFALMVSAGNDTTRYTMTYAMKEIIDRPDLLDELRELDDAGWKMAIEEFLRWASVTMHFRRTALRDVEVQGKQIKAGDKLLLWFVSGNRDDDKFESPFELNLRRDPNPHMTFGKGGPHACLGMWLARMEVKVMLQEFVKRAATVEQTEPHAYLRSNFISGIKRLPISVEWR
ncbi:MAG: cytochrome P450 [Chromatiales bacterium]|nr:MAG: cytochrome P450 [Chromatiales bacterium]